MATPIRLLILLSDESAERMELSRMPDTVEELIEQVKNECKLCGDIRLQYKDDDFGGIFVNLSSTSMIKDLTTIKIIQAAPDIVLSFVESVPSDLSDLDTSLVSQNTDTDDTIILSRSSSDSEGLRKEPWPKEFIIPPFSLETEGQLQRGNSEYAHNQTRLTPSSKMLSDILERLAEKIFSYKAYPTDADLSDVAEALTRKHPCLRQPDSFNESYGWKLKLKSKMCNYRTQLRSHGLSSELMVNTLKSKSREDAAPFPAKNVKKARRGETNYYPQPSGDSPENLEQERVSLLTEIKIRNNERTVREKMARTFQFRRQEIVDQKPTIENLMERWPALFQMEEVDAEFLRVTAVPLLTRFMAHLDKHSPQLLKIFRKKGGTTKAKTATILEFLDQGADADIRRECILKALIIYLGERVEDLIKEYMVSQKDQAEQELERTTMAVFVFRENSSLLQQPQDVGIVIDGVEVLNELPSIAAGVVMLFGLCYALNIEYPQGFRFTFEALQKILMELGSNKMTSKIRKLSSELKTAQ
ncbi:uncharacterized protein LOC118559847 [Fundulus heteroclitus]|uniref:uncharacterized protein LOC118559847 n=1 Tax=Fundulus heteroclitus TaxID=8078 RepID=UPI00165A27F6|nr:uncharacterized protein LOC118559847 [Fundulus heteroclitus]XP_035986264.1 uncharacterized protein LOC118559847 [Fundulus heteroclitus]XP_035986265.1 uncharacterized protein LOC118559847 [Fundulus heteroclitus]XP_035986266.1 uncharacterized protein LOC118559847 [Fundulus heteroclitus]